MAKTTRDVEQYTKFGRLIDDISRDKKYSFRRIAKESNTSHTSLVRACMGKRTPERETIEKWCTVLECDSQQRKNVMHSMGYATSDEMN